MHLSLTILVSTIAYNRLGNTSILECLVKRVTFLHLDNSKLGWGMLATFCLKLISIKNQHARLIM